MFRLRSAGGGLFFILFAAGAAFPAAQAPAQQSDYASEVRLYNNRLLQVYGRLSASEPGEPASTEPLRFQATAAIQQRAAAMAALIRENPSQALALAFSEDLRSRLRNAVPVPAGMLESSGAWEGPVEIVIEDGADLKTHRVHYRMSLGSETLNVHFATQEPADLECGKQLRVTGVRLGTEVAADSGSVTAMATGAPATCTPIGEQSSIVLLVNMPGTTPPDITPASVNDIFFASSGRSVSEFWRENSYGKTWAAGDVVGWVTLDANYTCDQTNEIRDAAIRVADSAVDFTRYSRIFIVMSGLSAGCGWSGLSTVGCSTLSSPGDGSFTASTSWMLASLFDTRDHGVKLAIHEGGHGLGLNHASSRDFGAEALGAPGVTGVLDEYGDEYSTMGAWTFAHYAAPHKAQLGWLTSDVQTITGNGSFSVQPAETVGATHALKIRRGIDDNNWLWVEYRSPVGNYDSTMNPLVFGGGLIHYEDSTTGPRSHLLDFTPETDSWSDPVLVPGKSWADPHTNVSIAVDSASANALNLHVAYGPLPCVAAAPSVAISPPNPSAYPGNAVTYTIAVTNRDSAACAPRSFSLSSLSPSWATSFSQSSLLISPSATVSETMSKVVPMGTQPATYSVDATVTDNTSSTGVAANVTVTPPCVTAAPRISMSPTTVSAHPGDSLVFTLTVTNQDSLSCASRTFSLSSVTPANWATVLSPTSMSLAPGSIASATMTKIVPVSAAAGSYTSDVSAAGPGTSAAVASANVSVQPLLTVTLSASGATFRNNATVTLTAKVLLGSAAASGTTVQFTMRYPSGYTTTKTATTDSKGQALWSYRIGAKDPKGSYQVSAQATSGGQTVTSAWISFSVQ